MPRKLVKHGTNSGYRAEIGAGNDPCPRCHNAHLVYNSQYTKAAKSRGLKYRSDQVIDNLYQPGKSFGGSRTGKSGVMPRVAPTAQPQSDDYTVTTEQSGTGRPSLSERVRNLTLGAPGSDNDPGNEFVSEDDIPSYLSVGNIDPDPDPDDEEYARVDNDSADYVINAAGMAKIEDTLGTYLSIFGMTFEMIDPYCGPVLAENFDNIVTKWSKVIAKYPKAADIFMNEKGGVIMLWIGAIQATWPVLFAMYEHHLSKNVQVDGGTVFRRANSAGVRPNDPMQPPMPDTFNYSAA